MSKYFVTPDLSSPSPIGDMTGYVLEVSEVAAPQIGGASLQLRIAFQVDGRVAFESIVPVQIPATEWPVTSPFSAGVVKAQVQFLLQTVAALLTAGMPASLLTAVAEAVNAAVDFEQVVIDSPTGQPYRCVKFKYNERAISRAEFATSPDATQRIAVLNGELSELVNLDVSGDDGDGRLA